PEQALRLVPVEPRGADDLLQLLLPRRRKIVRRGVAREQRRRDLVHPLVRALRREDRRREQLERVAMVQRALRVRVLPPEPTQDLQCALAFGGLALSNSRGTCI